LILTPGPNFIYVLTRGTTQGRSAALLSVIGLGVGVLVHTTLACIGVSTLIRSSYLAFQILKYAGSLYLIFIGLKTLQKRGTPASDFSQKSMVKTRILSQSIIASLTNPKTMLFFLSFLPQFVTQTSSNISVQLFLLGGIYMLLTILIYGTLAYLSGRIGQWLQSHTAKASRLNWITASSFIGLGIWAFLPDRR
ncbi:MAG TPA: LysE family translocator, partial [Candidatus Saccharimonadales bacterium]|nr:LysE family translocator [Candidatus Saccharimonadales bacterium]